MIYALVLSVIGLIVLGSAVLVGCRKSNRMRLMLLTLVMMLAVFCIRMPQYMREDSLPVAAVRSLAHAIQAVTMSENIDEQMDQGSRLLEEDYGHSPMMAAGYNDIVVDFYRIYSVALGIVAPVLGGALLLETLAAFFPYIRLYMPGYRPVFVLSRVNQQSLALAESIQEEIRARIVFQLTDTAQETVSEALEQRAKDMGAICLRGEVPLRKINRLIRSVTYIFIDPDEQENIKDLASRLAEPPAKGWLHRRRRVKCYAFAQSREAENAIDALARKAGGSANQIVCMLNVQENVAQHILERYPLYEYGREHEDGTKELHVLVVGSDEQAEHFFANAYVCGQMHRTKLTVTVTAPDAEEFSRRMYAAAPMLKHPEDPAARMCGGLQFIPMGDMVDEALLTQADYILVSLGRDAQNKDMAAKIRMEIDRLKLLDPVRAQQHIPILFVQEDDALYELYAGALKENSMPQGRGCELIPVGSRREQYSVKVLFCQERLFRGFCVHLTYNGMTGPLDEQKLQAEYAKLMNEAYSRRSSVSAAMHMDYRQWFLNSTTLSEQEVEDALAQVEHQRWTAYTMLDGYRLPTPAELQAYAYEPGFKHKWDALLLHPCLVESRCAPVTELWKERKPADALDELSLQLHDLVTGKLESMLGKEMLAPARKPQTRASAKRCRADILKALPSAMSTEELDRAERLISKLFHDYKDSDRDIVRQTDWIVTSARKYAVLLRSFWK